MDLDQYAVEARKQIIPLLPPKHAIDTLLVNKKFTGFRIGRTSFLAFDHVMIVGITKEGDNFVYKISPINDEYAGLGKKIGEALSKIK